MCLYNLRDCFWLKLGSAAPFRCAHATCSAASAQLTPHFEQTRSFFSQNVIKARSALANSPTYSFLNKVHRFSVFGTIQTPSTGPHLVCSGFGPSQIPSVLFATSQRAGAALSGLHHGRRRVAPAPRFQLYVRCAGLLAACAPVVPECNMRCLPSKQHSRRAPPPSPPA